MNRTLGTGLATITAAGLAVAGLTATAHAAVEPDPKVHSVKVEPYTTVLKGKQVYRPKVTAVVSSAHKVDGQINLAGTSGGVRFALTRQSGDTFVGYGEVDWTDTAGRYEAKITGHNDESQAGTASGKGTLKVLRGSDFKGYKAVRKGKKVILTGQLRHLGGSTFVGYRGQTVEFHYAKKSTAKKNYLGKIKTGRNGTFKISFAGKRGRWYVTFNGNATHDKARADYFTSK